MLGSCRESRRPYTSKVMKSHFQKSSCGATADTLKHKLGHCSHCIIVYRCQSARGDTRAYATNLKVGGGARLVKVGAIRFPLLLQP